MMRFAWMCFLVLLFPNPGFSQAGSDSLRVYLFLSETCPICQQSTPEIRRVQAAFPAVVFLGVFPSIESTGKTRAAFAEKYRLSFPLVADSARIRTTRFRASVTPEVVVTDASGSRIWYQGRIDNAFAALGKRRTVVTETYLYQALQAISKGQKPHPSRVEPLGCLIE
jgi:peroxiredoxin